MSNNVGNKLYFNKFLPSMKLCASMNRKFPEFQEKKDKEIKDLNKIQDFQINI